MPEWHEIALVEATACRYAAGSIIVPAVALVPAKVYDRRFEELLASGYAWLNLHAAGVIEHTLIVVVELPRAAGAVPRTALSVNCSGPEQGARVEIVAG